MEFEVTTASNGIHQLICMGESKQQLGEKVMSSLEALRINISEMIGSVQKVYIICYVKELKYIIKVNGATAEDDTLIINVSKDGEITHVERFSTEFDVTSAEEGIQKIVEFETRKKSPENVMSYLYSLRTNICHHVESNEGFCIHVYVMERQYKIKKKGSRDEANGMTICIDEKRNMQIQVHRFSTEFDVTLAEEGIQKIVELEKRNKIICMGESEQQYGEKVMSSLQTLSTDILEMVYPDQKVYILCYVKEQKYIIKVKGATDEDDTLTIKVSEDGDITHNERFSREFDVTSAGEGVQKIVEREKRKKPPENVMSYLYRFRTHICHHVGSNEKICIQVCVMERRYEIRVKGNGDEDNRITISIDEKGNVQTQMNRMNSFDITSDSPHEGLQKILNVRYCVFSADRQNKIEDLRTDLPKKLYGEENVKITVYVDQMCFTVNVKEAKWKVVVNITESKT